MDRRGTLLVFFVLICKSLACNPAWTPNKGKCYIINEFSYDIRMARRYCQMYGGDLAFVDSNNTFVFLQSLKNYASRDFWVKETIGIPELSERFTSTEPPSGCPYIRGNAVLYKSCEETMSSICELEDQYTSIECPKTWHLYGTTCYKPMPDADTFEKATDTCAIQRGNLAILDDISKEYHAASVILGLNKTFMVGARVNNDVIEWSNFKQFSPSCSQCIINSTGDCLGYRSSPEHPIVFSWVHLDCNSTHNYLCEIPPTLRPTTTTSTSAPTTLRPLQCPHGHNWKTHESSGYCFWETTYETEKLNWYQARTFCKAVGGDLATYQDSREELTGLGGAKGHYRGLWFGLKRDKNDEFSWVDGSRSSYTNWRFQEPKLKNKSKFCVMHGADESRWELDYCGVRRWFICKAQKTRNVTIPDVSDLFKKTSCNSTTSSVFNNWYQFEEHCYMKHTMSSYSWHMAQNFCNDNGAHLLSVHSFEETDFVINILSSVSDRNFWMGLSARGLGSELEWSDGTPVDFFYWENDNRNNTNAVDACFTFNALKGHWSENHCNEFRSVICKRGLNSSDVFIPSKPTPLLPGYCQKDWYQLGNNCYRVYGALRYQRINFLEASSECKKEKAELASIHSKEEQDFVIDLLLLTDASAWIGLSSSDRGIVYKWQDGSPIDFTDWMPSGAVAQTTSVCVGVSGNLRQWNAGACSREQAYICQKPKDPTLTEPPEDPFKCGNITDWYRLGNVCYGIFENQQLSWVAAQQKCREFDANLATFQNVGEGIFIKKKLAKKDNFLWIGVRQTQAQGYGLVNGRKMKHTNWLLLQPRPVSSKIENCVAMNAEARWMVKHCKESHAFICEWNSGEVLKPKAADKDETVSCRSSDWVHLGGSSCYKFYNYLQRTWSEAMLYCHQTGGVLASFQSEEEYSLVSDYTIEKYRNTRIMIGLAKSFSGSAAWVDGSPVVFAKWNTQRAFQYGSCVAMSAMTDEWMSIGCNGPKYPFICSSPVNQSSEETGSLETFHFEQDKQENLSNKLTTGGIFGIVICVVVVLAIVGVAAYYTCPATRQRVRLDDSDSL